MDAFKEFRIIAGSAFPVDIFLIDNEKSSINYGSHWHDYIELHYVLDGSVTLQYNDRFFEAKKNDIAIFHSGVIHSVACGPGAAGQLLVVQFLPDIIHNSLNMNFESRYIFSFLNVELVKTYHITETHKNSRDVFRLLKSLHREFRKKEEGYELFVKGCIYQLIAYLLRNNILNLYKHLKNEDDIKRLDPVLKHIETNYTREISLSEAAHIMNLEYSYFSRFFKRATGRSFKEYVDYIRICEAEKLILSQNMNISSAAYEVGYSNITSFNRVFRRIRHCNPGSLKKSKSVK